MQVHGDADAVTDALRNLIENAVTYAPSGTEVTITVDPVGICQRLRSGTWCRLRRQSARLRALLARPRCSVMRAQVSASPSLPRSPALMAARSRSIKQSSGGALFTLKLRRA